MSKAPTKVGSKDNERSAEETERIREATLKKILSTPPKPFTPTKDKTKKGKGGKG